MKFLIASDLHIEFYKNTNIFNFFDISKLNEPTSLILAGDIGYPYHQNYEIFIKQCSETFKNVIIITGNHEYYCGLPISLVDEKISDIVKNFNNVHFLQKNELIIDNIVILGCTLWTYIPDNISNIVSRLINDYRKIIYLENGNEYQYDVEYNNNLNKEHIQWIFNNIEKYNNKKIIVITHHLPSWNMIHPKYLSNKQDTSINWAFANNLDELILKSNNLHYWICGHSHSSNLKKIGNCQILLNPKGYPLKSNNHENIEYNNSLIIDLS